MGQSSSSVNNMIETKTKSLEENKEQIRNNLTKLTDSDENLSQLTEMDLKEIQELLVDNKINSLDLLHAYQLKCLKLIENGNSGICEFILEADQWSQSLKHTNYNQNTLTGIPVSLKELCCVQGYDVTYGLIKRCNQPSSNDSCVVKVLKKQGVIPFVLTATSQTALTLSGFNPVFGNMFNPVSSFHEPGGSSSGEGVLIALHGSPVGLGTDLAGSIRIPCSFCGLVGLKPTANRISNQDTSCIGYFKPFVLRVSVGPMGRKVDDLAKMMRTLLCQKMFELDSSVPPLYFNDKIYLGQEKEILHIGYYDTFDDLNLPATVPSIKRVINESINYFQSRGHRITLFKPPNLQHINKIYSMALSVDFNYNLKKALTNEPKNEHSKLLSLIPFTPYCLKWLSDKIIDKFWFGKSLSNTRYVDHARNEKSILQLISDIESYRKEFQNAWIDAGDFDVLICPVLPFPAFPISAKPIFIYSAIIYTVLYNLIDYPAGTVCIDKVNEEDIQQSELLCEQYKLSTDKYQKYILELQSTSKGLPLGIQVVGKPWREEIVLRVMKELEQFGESKT